MAEIRFKDAQICGVTAQNLFAEPGGGKTLATIPAGASLRVYFVDDKAIQILAGKVSSPTTVAGVEWAAVELPPPAGELWFSDPGPRGKTAGVRQGWVPADVLQKPGTCQASDQGGGGALVAGGLGLLIALLAFKAWKG